MPLIDDRGSFTGLAAQQVAPVLDRIGQVVAKQPQAAGYAPGAILSHAVAAVSGRRGDSAPRGP